MPISPLPTTHAAGSTGSGPPADGICRGRSRWLLMASWPPAELAIAAQSGDSEAAGELFRRVRARARRAACAFCLDIDADDAVAEGLSAALRGIGQLRQPAAVEGWMIRCVVRSAIDLSRQRQRQPPVDGVESLVGGSLATGESAAERAMAVLERDQMAEVVRGMHPGLRLLLYLRYEAGLSVQHIALALGRPAGTIRRQCTEARRIAGQRFLSHQLRPAIGACAEVTAFLCQEPYRRPAASARRRTGDHLRRCSDCRDRQTELASVLTELGYRRVRAGD
jgi:RNA polymerase sigma factor (sigma-70 family)